MLPAEVVNVIFSKVIRGSFPPLKIDPAHNFGVPRKGGSLRGGNYRRTLRRYGDSVFSVPVVFDGNRKKLSKSRLQLPASRLRIIPPPAVATGGGGYRVFVFALGLCARCLPGRQPCT